MLINEPSFYFYFDFLQDHTLTKFVNACLACSANLAGIEAFILIPNELTWNIFSFFDQFRKDAWPCSWLFDVILKECDHFLNFFIVINEEILVDISFRVFLWHRYWLKSNLAKDVDFGHLIFKFLPIVLRVLDFKLIFIINSLNLAWKRLGFMGDDPQHLLFHLGQHIRDGLIDKSFQLNRFILTHDCWVLMLLRKL